MNICGHGQYAARHKTTPRFSRQVPISRYQSFHHHDAILLTSSGHTKTLQPGFWLGSSRLQSLFHYQMSVSSTTSMDPPSLQQVLHKIGLQQYLDVFLANGYQTWADVTGITEEALVDLKIKLGHRRQLQREIFSYFGYAFNEYLPAEPHTGSQ
ncbi:hypothetical protein BT63DRAFT_424263 [Microthyrium microscopicum]|uniref:SAM domain-containing protein n=1 Tax=Microthyrium microscopicum TaxID=703497 RepID=A0A6A6UDT7_9PEZI|nr:hypothetical protein BT63DRAFT_424263 [Microthyrium microscopicum]